jgi:ABC-type nitrate/sulfonate/bicarbonate transport system substrate-binding protein
MLRDEPDVVRRVVAAFAQGADWTRQRPDEAAQIGAAYIGVHSRFIRAALGQNRPNVQALASTGAMNQILDLMQQLGYLRERPTDYVDLQYLQELKSVPTPA